MLTTKKTYVVLLMAAMLCGCPGYTKPVARARRLSASEKNFESLWRASLEVLRKYRFNPSIQDRRTGLIQTEAMTSRHFTEFWRSEASSSHDAIESSLHTIYRTATVKITQTDEADETFQAVVKVEVARSNRREPQITTASQAHEMFALTAEEHLGVIYGGQAGKKADVVVPLRRDKELENILAAEISVASGQMAVSE
ncbi:MAG: hypothetical protein ACYTF6_04535 [Planctomycetota bacterium]